MGLQKENLKVGMIGIGDITSLHYKAYQNFEHAELAAICDLNDQWLQQRSKEWGISKCYKDYKELLKDPEIDIVEVNTPHDVHKMIVVDALDAGKHVACQKPISTTIADAEAMIEASKRNPGRFRVLENFVFYPPYRKAKELMDSGEIGEPLTVRFKLGNGIFGSRWVPLKSEIWHLMETDRGMGQAVFDDGYHKLSMAIFLVGEIESVKGFIDRSFSYADLPAQLIWRYKDKRTLGSFDIALQTNLFTRSKYFGADERIEIVGTKGIINLTRCTGQIVDDPPLILYKEGQRYLFDDIEADWQASFTAGIRDFPIAIKENRETLLTGQRALDILKFAYALIITAKIGVEMKPADITDDMVREYLLK